MLLSLSATREKRLIVVEGSDYRSLREVVGQGDLLQFLEQSAKQAVARGLSAEIAMVLQGFAGDDTVPDTRDLAAEILGAFARWEYWPASHVAERLAEIDRLGEGEPVIPLAKSLVREYPNCVLGWLKLAEGLSDCGRNEEALDAIGNALDLRPRHIPARILAATIEIALNRTGAARRTLRSVLQDAPGDTDARFLAGTVEEREGNRKQALAHYRIAAKASDDRMHWEAVRDTAERLGDQNTVLEADLAIVRLDSTSGTANLHAAQSLVAAGRHGEARDYADRAANAGFHADPFESAEAIDGFRAGG
ncbi:MAG: tetratricopeptide repeat protein [Armatimonadota bacterium]